MRTYIFISILLLAITFCFILSNGKTEMTLTYFPIDDEEQFSLASSALTLTTETNTIEWTSESTSERKLYLRQDISLLFNNGSLFGILNKWAQHVNRITQSEQFTVTPHTLLETISFHHGEHHKQGQITSIQQMSQDKLYILNNGAMRTPQSTKEQQDILALDNEVSEQLTKHWEQLINYYNIEAHNYIQIPLTEIIDLANYFPNNFSNKTTTRIIGQLWEGLYKNYLIEAFETESNDMMPLILLANDFSHLQVLYTINAENRQLYQQIDATDSTLIK